MDRQEKIYTYLEEFLTENKKELFKRVISERTQHLTVVLENLYQSFNANAVIRTCDVFGIQDLHIVENEYEFSHHKYVSAGSTKWVDLHRYNREKNNTRETINRLKNDGFRIVATKPDPGATSLYHLDISQKTAIVFGNELKGITDIVEEMADETMVIPMHGFTESLNISVSVALVLHYLTLKMKSSNINWEIEGEDKYTILVDWAKKCIPRSDLLEKKILTEILK